MVFSLSAEQLVKAPLEEVFDFFVDSRNLTLLTPPTVKFRLLSIDPKITHQGQRLDFEIRPFIVRFHWISEITEFVPPFRFVDEQIEGPYRYWRHDHHFRPHLQGTIIRDQVSYELPLGLMGHIAHTLFVRQQIQRIFTYRRQQLEKYLDR